VHYPRGYKITVRGARMTSRGGASLRLRGTGRGIARVTVTPR
jgi:hypothetical protein